ncbi:MAG: pyruvate dehydrogenase (acetyl-transferring), homodimeric type, partial [Planctomycetota bacterium]
MASTALPETSASLDPLEIADWYESLEDVVRRYGPDEAARLIELLEARAVGQGLPVEAASTTPYINTISPEDQPAFPGDRELEFRIRSIIRWNAAAMVVKANKRSDGIGGHISTYASSALLYEIGFNHFFHAQTAERPGDMVYFQGHASPGMYARAYVEGRFDEDKLDNFRREIPRGQGLSSYPHPWLMPDFWQFPTVSMGLGPITSIYHARFLRYLEHRGLAKTDPANVWCFLGDGEMDEPESLGAITLPVREKLDNLIWVINCNLQRLDGPVRGNGKIVQEMEGIFRGAGWNVIKVLWGEGWDDLLARDKTGKLIARLGEMVDGEYQTCKAEGGAAVRKIVFGGDPDLEDLVKDYSDDELKNLRRGGHDTDKVYAAYAKATKRSGRPTVILAKTVKGYGLGEAGEAKNVAHNTKKMTSDEFREFRDRFDIPVKDDDIEKAPFFRPQPGTPEHTYIHERRKALGGFVPARVPTDEKLPAPELKKFAKFLAGTGPGKEASTTFVFGQFVANLMKDKAVGKRVVPIIPDEARTFGMEGLFKQVGIYAPFGQLYEPVDRAQLMYYKEAKDGQLLEEGINEAGAMSSFVAAATAYANVGVTMIPFYVFYSMFGFQRVGDLCWLAGDSRSRGFLIGGTSGRTSLNGEGLQHEDGHSPLIASTIPNLVSYDPAFAFEVVTLLQDGLRRMYAEGEQVFYYMSVYNDAYYMPPMPNLDGDKFDEDVREGICKGLYRFKVSELASPKVKAVAQLFGSGPIM